MHMFDPTVPSIISVSDTLSQKPQKKINPSKSYPMTDSKTETTPVKKTKQETFMKHMGSN